MTLGTVFRKDDLAPLQQLLILCEVDLSAGSVRQLRALHLHEELREVGDAFRRGLPIDGILLRLGDLERMLRHSANQRVVIAQPFLAVLANAHIDPAQRAD